jgi:hypothetical protein
MLQVKDDHGSGLLDQFLELAAEHRGLGHADRPDKAHHGCRPPPTDIHNQLA